MIEDTKPLASPLPLPLALPLAFRGVTRKYLKNSQPAVDRVDLEVSEGEIVALIGESGSGKTTLLRLAAGLETPDSGLVVMEGRVVAGDSSQREIPPEEREIGLVFQDGALFPHLTAERNVAYGLKKGDPEARAARVRECFELVGLGGKEKRFPHELSGGERQRLALARAVAPSPKLLLLDEPFSHLDPALRRKLREEIRNILRSLGQTALLVTHDPEDALAIATRVAIMDGGRLVQTGSPAEVYREPANRYCAERFGPANLVFDPLTGVMKWTRPEDARWIACDLASEGDMVTVVEVHEMGPVFEVRVRPDTTPGESAENGTWLCFLKDAEFLQSGDRGRVAWRGEPKRVAWKS